MKVPEFLFALINPVMRALLRSRCHAWFGSDSLMLVTFTGRRSGRRYTTPVRYLRTGEGVRCFSDRGTRWWRNLVGGADVTLRIAGRELPFHAVPELDDRARIRAALVDYLARFPQDAAYQGIRLGPDRRPDAADLERALGTAVVVECRPRVSAVT